MVTEETDSQLDTQSDTTKNAMRVLNKRRYYQEVWDGTQYLQPCIMEKIHNLKDSAF